MATVYHFKIWDPATNEYIIGPLKSTPERIQQVGGVIMLDTAEEVAASALDEYGRYDPRRRSSESE
jgi:hypothetical protein